MPWVIHNYSNSALPQGADPGDFRDLSKNMALMGDPRRQEEFIKNYNDEDIATVMGCRFHSGSHYSCPGHILYFLVRVNPYLDINFKFHDGKFDDPDREFFSLEGTYRNALKEK